MRSLVKLHTVREYGHVREILRSFDLIVKPRITHRCYMTGERFDSQAIIRLCHSISIECHHFNYDRCKMNTE